LSVPDNPQHGGYLHLVVLFSRGKPHGTAAAVLAQALVDGGVAFPIAGRVEEDAVDGPAADQAVRLGEGPLGQIVGALVLDVAGGKFGPINGTAFGTNAQAEPQDDASFENRILAGRRGSEVDRSGPPCRLKAL
jgi:hypothetical protein